MEGWKKKHANDSEEALEHPLVQRVVEEFETNVRNNPHVAHEAGEPGLFRFGLTKVMGVVAQVARAQALGFDPDLLRLSPEQADQHMLKMAAAAVEMGRPVVLIADEPESERE